MTERLIDIPYERRVTANEVHVSKIFDAFILRRSEWMGILNRESMGGNAGSNRSAINAFVDRETGEIIEFGNPQDIKENIRSNDKYGEACFIYDHGNTINRLLKKTEEVVPPYFTLGNCDCLEQAKLNLNEAITRYNQEIIKNENK